MQKISKKSIRGLERHLYAPELNRLHFRNGSAAKCPGMRTIEEAIKYIEEHNVPAI